VIRQRVNLRTPALAYIVRALAIVLALGLIWYGLMVVLLAVKVSPHTVNSISAYRTIYNAAAKLGTNDFTTAVRLIAGFGGLIAFLIFMYLALQELPRPYLARGDMELSKDEHGTIRVEPRAIERVAEVAAARNDNVTSAVGRLGDEELNVSIALRRASTVADTLRDVRQRIRSDLERHEMTSLPVNVTLTGYDRKTRRELS